MSIISDIIENILKGDPLTIGILAALILFLTVIILRKEPIYGLWMKFAFGLAYVNTRIILFFLFFTIFTAYGLVFKMLGKDLLNIKKSDSKTYWEKRESKRKKEDYLKQF